MAVTTFLTLSSIIHFDMRVNGGAHKKISKDLIGQLGKVAGEA